MDYDLMLSRMFEFDLMRFAWSVLSATTGGQQAPWSLFLDMTDSKGEIWATLKRDKEVGEESLVFESNSKARADV